MVAFVLSLALALVSHHAAPSPHFPTVGVITPGSSFAGIKVGQTEQQVTAIWGHHYVPCTSYCVDTTWLYEYAGSEPLGAAVRFEKNKVVAVFSLGSPAGWHTSNGLAMGDP